MSDGAVDTTSMDGAAMYDLIGEIFPICRSITGDGVRETLERLQREIPLEIHEVPSGTEVFDWTVPKEWNIRDAYVKSADGRRIVDFRQSNLHVMSYSVPVDRTMTAEELAPHLHSLPEHPEWIPYRTSYYEEKWGFCVSHEVREELSKGSFEVRIDSTLSDGHLTYGEWFLPGESSDEVFLSCHCCHPSLANDNLSGIAVATSLARWLSEEPRRYSYRLVFIPGTIGSITWLARNEATTDRIRHGLVLSCLGDRGGLTYKRSRRGDTPIDRAAEHVLTHSGSSYELLDFVPYGYDERQYCSPGFDLPVGCFMRTPNGRFPEYHTSADNLDLIDPDSLRDSLDRLRDVVGILEHDGRYLNTNPKCEPRLGKRGLYSKTGGRASIPGYEMALLWVLNLSDGDHDLLEIANRAGLPFEVVHRAALDLERHDLLKGTS